MAKSGKIQARPAFSGDPCTELQGLALAGASVCAMPIINLSVAARVIEEQTGQPCRRSNLDYMVRAGILKECVTQVSPVRIESDLLVEEYLAKGNFKKRKPTNTVRGKKQSDAINMRTPVDKGAVEAIIRAREAKANSEAQETVQRSLDAAATRQAAQAWAELEKARKLQIERLASEGFYVRVSEVQPEWEKAFLAVSRAVMGIASKVKSEFPEAEFDLIESIRSECRNALVKAFDRIMETEPEPEQPRDEEGVFVLPDEGDMKFD